MPLTDQQVQEIRDRATGGDPKSHWNMLQCMSDRNTLLHEVSVLRSRLARERAIRGQALGLLEDRHQWSGTNLAKIEEVARILGGS